MAIPTVVITGKVLTPGGDAPTSGYLNIKLSQPGSVLDGADSQRVAASLKVTLGTDGSLPAGFDLVPNDAITPSGTYYRVDHVVMTTVRRETWTEKWQIASTPTPLDIGEVPRIDVETATAYTTSAAVSASVLAAAQADADAAAASAATAVASAASSSEDATSADISATAAAASAAAAASSAPPQQWFVDSVNGDDSNNGTAPATPLQTIAALLAETITAGATINLARGSHWREQIVGLPDSVSVVAYGNGPRPLLDASSVAANASFTKTGGLTNVYQIAWSHSLTSANFHRVWVDGVRLTRAASQAACDAAPGSFYAAAPTAGGPDTVYVHPPGSTDPTADGKLYELAARPYGIDGPARGGQIIGIHTRRNGSSVASLVSRNYARDCLAEDGYYHNFWVEGVCEDCVASGIEPPAVSASLFVTYATVTNTIGAVYRRTKAITAPGGEAKVSGYLFHTASAAVKLRAMVFEDAEATNVETAFNGGSTDSWVLLRPRMVAVKTGITTSATTTYVLGGLYNAGMRGTWTWANPDHRWAIKVTGTSGTTALTVRGLRAVTRSAQAGLGLIAVDSSAGPVNLDIRYSTLVGVDLAGYSVGVYVYPTAGGSLVLRNNIISGLSKTHQVWPSTTTLDIDDNVLFPTTADVSVEGVQYADIAAYRTAYPALDPNSTAADPVFAGSVRAGDTRVAETSPLWTAGAAAVGAGADFWGEGGDAALLDAFYAAAGSP